MTKKKAGASLGLDVPLDRPVVLVGLMGAGKTTVGRRLASRLGIRFVDTDAEIEVAAGMSIAEIFEEFGEQEFRSGERRVIARLLTEIPQVLATGGGAFMDAETRQTIKEQAYSIWLKADIGLLVERVSRRDTRPLLRKGDPAEILTRLSEQRGPVYAGADLVVQSDAGPHSLVVDNIIRALNSHRQVQKTPHVLHSSKPF